jgi:hypothetical protein
MPTRVIRITLLYILVVTFFLAPAQGQVRNDKKFSSVPKHERERLVQRFNLYIEYDRAQQYDRLYDLYSETYIKGQKLSKASFLQVVESIPVSMRSMLLEYKPTSVNKTSYERESLTYEITGRAKIQQGSKVIEKELILEACLQNGDWFFSAWLERT